MKSVLVVGPGWNEKVPLMKANEGPDGDLVVYVNYPANIVPPCPETEKKEGQ